MTARILVVLVVVFFPLKGVCDESPYEIDLSLRPSILKQQDGTKYGFAIKHDMLARCHLIRGKGTTYRKAALLEFTSEGMLVADKDLNPHPLRAEALLGASLNMSGPKIARRGAEEGEEIISQYPFNYGRLSAGLNIGYETDQTTDNRNATAGAELAYVLTENQGLKALVPSLSALYEWVCIDKSEFQDRLRIDDDTCNRFRIAASWKIPIGDLLPAPFNQFSFHADVRYFRDYGRPGAIEEAKKDESAYIAGVLNYTFEKTILFGMLGGIFLKVADGRIPPAAKELFQIHLGIILFQAKT